MREKRSDDFENSRRATCVQREYVPRNPLEFAGYDEHCWGLTAGDGLSARLPVMGTTRFPGLGTTDVLDGDPRRSRRRRLSGPLPCPWATRHGKGEMGNRSVTAERFEEIARRLRDGRSKREIARALNCSRKTVREVRDGLRVSPAIPPAVADPLWMSQVDWSMVVHELGLGHPIQFIWEERAQSLTGYPLQSDSCRPGHGRVGIARPLLTRPGNRGDDDRELPHAIDLAPDARLPLRRDRAAARRVSRRLAVDAWQGQAMTMEHDGQPSYRQNPRPADASMSGQPVESP